MQIPSPLSTIQIVSFNWYYLSFFCLNGIIEVFILPICESFSACSLTEMPSFSNNKKLFMETSV